ncbi:C-type lectin domain family 9 member A [Sorex araneus]|uniref:C-type lectin domain family 9 member A n=1 Tax=Sorex araneus TaxID=42254 RepID=UPI0024337F4D|nr:C-type lectin domain family 9 member A [Sorex araneus]
MSDIQEEEPYTSLQWDNPSPNHYEKFLPSNKYSGTSCVVLVILSVVCVSLLTTSIFFGIKWFQVSTLAMQQQEKLIQYNRAPTNITQWNMNYALQMKYCQTLMQNSPCSAQNYRPCPDNWIQSGESCYYISQTYSQWNSSKKRCLNEDAKLLQIDNKEEMIFVTGLKKIEQDFDYWVGLYQDELRQSWLWQDGSPLSQDL